MTGFTRKENVKAFHWEMGTLSESRVLAGHFGRDKMRVIVTPVGNTRNSVEKMGWW